jgi:hypothetical protein
MRSQIAGRAQKTVKRLLGSFAPERRYLVGGTTFVVNRQDSAFGIFDGSRAADYTVKDYAEAATKTFLDIGDGCFDGIHPALRRFRSRVSSWIPYFHGQTTAYIFNFPSVQYGLNNPFVIVARYVLFSEDGKVLDRMQTRVLLPNTMACFSGPASPAEAAGCEGRGRLILYVYDPSFRPVTNEFRFFGLYRSEGLYRCGVHSWLSARQEIFRGKKRFAFRCRIPSTDGGERYGYCQELFSPLDCVVKRAGPAGDGARAGSRHGGTELARAEELGLADGAFVFTEGYFIAGDDSGKVARIWHDNGEAQTTHSYPAERHQKDFFIEADFYLPAGGYFAKLVFADPIANNILIGDSITISAFRMDAREPFFSRAVTVGTDQDESGTKFHQLNLRDFCAEMERLAADKDEIVQLTVSFKPVGSGITIGNINDIQMQVYVYSCAGAVCDQYHNGVSYASLSNPMESPRTNKFGPFVVDDRHVSYVIINNKFPAYMSRTGGSEDRSHTIRLTMYLPNELETRTVFLHTSPERKFYALNVRDTFNLAAARASTGIVHLFCPTANFWSCYMTVGRAGADASLLCDHFTGG